ncbi:MAG: arginine--tRNA ligase [Clostridia bacterium]|nr:MAG: arginine--tRNA ligase [Clostridia bacterium]
MILGVNPVEEVKNQVYQVLVRAAETGRQAGELTYSVRPDFVIEVPREAEHGAFATNLAMLLARENRRPPRELAGILVNRMDLSGTWVAQAEVAGPGFINFHLDPGWLQQVPLVVEAEGRHYGTSSLGQGQKVQVEFVSANPTGVLHMGNARGAALGDSMANLLEAAGYEVTREFYINDAGNQIENFARSLEARYLQLLGQDVPLPDEGYHGEDLTETMRHFLSQRGEEARHLAPGERRQVLVEFALQEKLADIRRSLADFGVEYDVWFSEQTLHASGEVQRAIEELRTRGHIYEHEGALWFKTSAFGDSKDEVVVRSNGVPTYFAADIAYHRNKFERGFGRVINIWGADHHGHVDRLRGAMQALGYDPGRLTIILMQLVRLFSGGEILRMSKRTGTYVTLDELVEEVGRDAARYFFLMRSADSHLDFDLDLAKSQSQENPVYYVQYAHARIMSIMRQAAARDYQVRPAAEVKLDLLRAKEELAMLRHLADYPDLVAGAARALEPHRLPRYAHELASIFHQFYTNCRVLTEDRELREARLALTRAAQIVLANVLGLMGVTAPERM